MLWRLLTLICWFQFLKNQKKTNCEVKGVELIRVKNLDFCVKHKRCEDIFYTTNQILSIQRLYENNESATQNIDVTFQLWAIDQQLELLSKTYKDLKDEVNLIKQQNNGANCQWNTVWRAIWNIICNFEEFINENIDVGEDDNEFAFVSQGIRSNFEASANDIWMDDRDKWIISFG